MKHLDVDPNLIEAIAHEHALQVELDPETRRMHVEFNGEEYVSTPLPVLGQAS